MPDHADKELYEAILNSIPNGIYVTNGNGAILFYNKAIVALIGPQLHGEKVEDRAKDYGFYLPDQKTPWPVEQLPLVRVIKSDQPSGNIMFVRNKFRPEGVWITNYAYPLRSNGETIGAVTILKEIELASDRGFPSIDPNVPPNPLG